MLRIHLIGGIDMKIKSWTLTLTWEDGTENDVSCYVPVYLVKAVEEFIDYWEEKYSDDEENEDE
jgi:hypothetical protein